MTTMTLSGGISTLPTACERPFSVLFVSMTLRDTASIPPSPGMTSSVFTVVPPVHSTFASVPHLSKRTTKSSTRTKVRHRWISAQASSQSTPPSLFQRMAMSVSYLLLYGFVTATDPLPQRVLTHLLGACP